VEVLNRIDKYAIASYKANYDTKGEVEIGDVDKFTSDLLFLINRVDLLKISPSH